jgi:mannitol/fructose-specific phosphotransferase system IIA component
MAPANSFANGVYTVQQSGVFLVTYNQRFDRADTANNYIRIAIARNGNENLQGGLHAIFGR